MQTASSSYKKSMGKPLRNRAYIRAYLGVINSKAQQNITADNGRNSFMWFSNMIEPLYGDLPDKVYATAEQDFSTVDGSMFFPPYQGAGFDLYNQGIVTNDMCGSATFTFHEFDGLDIKGMTIDFGDCYPTEFTISNDIVTRQYKNNARLFQTEDTFDETSFITISAVSMVNGAGRLRIYRLSTGVVNAFGNKEVKSFNQTEYVSSITDSIPSLDMSITVDNQNLYYNPDVDESALSYLEVGQQMSVAFGYDITGNGDIEWMPETTAYLKSWSASYTEAKFSASDRFDLIETTYSRGVYAPDGISLYALAEDVFADMGIESTEYYIDPYLKDVLVNNPIPNVKHTEALQIIANAGRCALYIGRNNKIYVKSSFVPDVTPSCNGETEYSSIENVLDIDAKDAYAICSSGFSRVDGSMFFLPHDSNYLYTGYVSSQVCDENGLFAENPIITLTLEAGFPIFSFYIQFREVAPKEFKIRNYLQNELVEEITISDPELVYRHTEQLQMLDRMDIVFTVGQPNTRIAVDAISLSDIITDYYITDHDLTGTLTADRIQKTHSISVHKNFYREGSETKDLTSGDIAVDPNNTYTTAYFSNASKVTGISVTAAAGISAQIVEHSCYSALIHFVGVTEKTTLKYTIVGKEYVVDESDFTVVHNKSGADISWNNPLISTNELAEKVEGWLANYYLSNTDYSINWRGDPRVDANDLFYLDNRTGLRPMIRSYSNTLNFNGAFSGSMKARKVVM